MPTRPRWTCVLWDVDGTIVDASEGILRRLTVTLAHFGRPTPTRAELVHWIGPPMYDSFQVNVRMTPAEASEAVTFYRTLGKSEGYTAGAKLIDGIGELIGELSADGVAQATASSKPERQVDALMQHFGLAPYFATLVGASDDERTMSSKSEVIGEALRRLDALGVDTSRAVLIGDRHHDIDGAADHDIPVVFVRWGFSWPHESEGAQATVDTVAELRDLLLVADADG
ncbi:HAD hydrolase-like protein [Microbacterium immunditiarum]|uniref:Phosphoglycolate phosphatase n=1 Tax=Microbacterium immunditiarum TaxID=337480 RepID=A0A7Y9GND8_9MICO|nr:HAD hydrolase-like protein [Microbacterium immunditiarum]NYE18575.1 phosphoglycolate phosphatase [Microbacterium immunditiarum]